MDNSLLEIPFAPRGFQISLSNQRVFFGNTRFIVNQLPRSTVFCAEGFTFLVFPKSLCQIAGTPNIESLVFCTSQHIHIIHTYLTGRLPRFLGLIHNTLNKGLCQEENVKKYSKGTLPFSRTMPSLRSSFSFPASPPGPEYPVSSPVDDTTL